MRFCRKNLLLAKTRYDAGSNKEAKAMRMEELPGG